MELPQMLALYGQIACLSALLLGLLVRRLASRCVLFFLYMSAVLVTDLRLALEPELFTWANHVGVELLHSALRMGLGVELAWRLFARLPSARASVAMALLGVGLLTLAAVSAALATLAAPPGAPLELYFSQVARGPLPRMQHGTAWMFGVVLFAKLYYRVPAHPLHAAILRGLVPVLLAFTVAASLLETFGWDVRSLANYGYTVAYQVLLVYWNLVVWRSPGGRPGVPGQVVQTLQPWE